MPIDNLESWTRATLVGVPEDMRAPTLVRAATAAGIDPFLPLEFLQRINAARTAPKAPSAPRMPSIIRMARAEEREPLPATMYVPTTALEPLNDPLLSASAKVLFMHILTLAGAGRVLETLTVSLAKLLGCSRRAIQVWRRELVDAGLIVHHYDPVRGIVTLTVTDLVVPSVPTAPPIRMKTPTPDMRFLDRWKARMAALRRMGKNALGGANHRPPINQVKDSKGIEAIPG